MAAGQCVQVSLDDIAVHFSLEEWEGLQEWQKALYQEVMAETLELVASLGHISGSGTQDVGSPEEGIDPLQLQPTIAQSDRTCCGQSESQEAARDAAGEAPEDPGQTEPVPLPSPDCWEVCHSSPAVPTCQELPAGNGAFACSEYAKDSFESQCPVYQPEKQPVTWGEYMNSFDWLTHLQMDLRTHTGEKMFPCSECEESFSEITDLKVHKRRHTREKLCACPECGKSFRGNQALSAHRRSHRSEKRFACIECDERFGSMTDLGIHQRRHDREKPWICPECGKTFGGNQALAAHRRSHTFEKRFSCSDCEERFSNKADFGIHQRMHAREKLWMCPECGKCLRTVQALMMHKRSHKAERRFPCAACGESFDQEKNLRKHQEVHSARKAFPCPECGKVFTGTQALRKHRQTHTRERLFLYMDCGTGFTDGHSPVSHPGEKADDGTRWGNAFSEATDLLAHQTGIIGERQFPCKECGRCYIRKRDLTVHLKIHEQRVLEEAAKEETVAELQSDFCSSLHENLVVSTAFLQDLISSTSTFQYD